VPLCHWHTGSDQSLITGSSELSDRMNIFPTMGQ
jgi:hypothetical protein